MSYSVSNKMSYSVSNKMSSISAKQLINNHLIPVIGDMVCEYLKPEGWDEAVENWGGELDDKYIELAGYATENNLVWDDDNLVEIIMLYNPEETVEKYCGNKFSDIYDEFADDTLKEYIENDNVWIREHSFALIWGNVERLIIQYERDYNYYERYKFISKWLGNNELENIGEKVIIECYVKFVCEHLYLFLTEKGNTSVFDVRWWEKLISYVEHFKLYPKRFSQTNYIKVIEDAMNGVYYKGDSDAASSDDSDSDDSDSDDSDSDDSDSDDNDNDEFNSSLW